MTITAPAPTKRITRNTTAELVLRTGVLDADEAVRLLSDVVAKKGRDRVSTVRTYFDPENPTPELAGPVCIIGHLFDLLGKNLSDLHSVTPGVRENGNQIDDIDVQGLRITPDARAVLTVAQEVQDGHSGFGDRTWGAALDAARIGLRRIVGNHVSVDNATDGIDAGPSVEDLVGELEAALDALEPLTRVAALGVSVKRAIRDAVEAGLALTKEVAA